MLERPFVAARACHIDLMPLPTVSRIHLAAVHFGARVHVSWSALGFRGMDPDAMEADPRKFCTRVGKALGMLEGLCGRLPAVCIPFQFAGKGLHPLVA
jgi:hypothetical protein